MKTRTITGIIFVIIMLGSVLLGQYVFGVFYLLLTLLCLREFYGLIKQSGIVPNVPLGLLNGIFMYVVFALVSYQDIQTYHKLLFILPVTLIAIPVHELFKQSSAPLTNIAYTFLGLTLFCIPFAFFHALAYIKGDFNFHYPLAFLLLLWANDTGAYVVGMKFGKTKLFERHSPKKTWEGLFGGIAIAAGVALLISHYYHELPWNRWVAVAILISCFGTLGDLVESMFKRSIDVKDSGGILPGHGGLLDRFDGLFIAAPVVYTYLYFMLN
jgi:phosphatidate cytidylyltransferase